MDDVRAPLLQKTFPDMLQVNTTLSPSQKLRGPDADITGAGGIDLISVKGADVPLIQCAGSFAVTV